MKKSGKVRSELSVPMNSSLSLPKFRKKNGGSFQLVRPTEKSGKATGKLVDGMTEAQWKRFRNLTDEEVHRRALADPDAQPTTAAFWKNARMVWPEKKMATSIRLDPEVLTWFKRAGKGYQTRINAVLRTYIEAKSAKRARA